MFPIPCLIIAARKEGRKENSPESREKIAGASLLIASTPL